MHQAADDRYQQMPYARCGQSGLQLPRISLGLWQNFGGSSSFESSREMVLKSFDRGITHFDLANNYGPPPGSAEENFGRILATDLAGYRDELIISTKAGYLMWPGPYGEWGSRKYLLASLEQSLRRMQLDYVDIFYSHRYDPNTPLEETMGALATAVSSGRALYVGISSYGPQRTREAAALLRELKVPFVIHQPSYSLLNRWIEQGRNLANVRALDQIARERGQSLAQMAIAWVLRQPAVTSALIGASRWEQVEECLGALRNVQFSAGELQRIDHHALEGDLNIWAASSRAG